MLVSIETSFVRIWFKRHEVGNSSRCKHTDRELEYIANCIAKTELCNFLFFFYLKFIFRIIFIETDKKNMKKNMDYIDKCHKKCIHIVHIFHIVNGLEVGLNAYVLEMCPDHAQFILNFPCESMLQVPTIFFSFNLFSGY